MTTTEIANRLVELCRKGDFTACYEELYSPRMVRWSESNFSMMRLVLLGK